MRRIALSLALVLLVGTTAGLPAAAVARDSARAPGAAAVDAPVYQRAPEAIAAVIDAKPSPMVRLSPDGRWMLLVERVAMPPVADLAQPMLRLGGARINPATNAPFGPRILTGLSIRPTDGSSPTKPVTLTGLSDAEPFIGMPVWSHDNQRFAFTVTRETGVELWVAEAGSAAARALTAPRLNTAAGGAMQWMPDGVTILAKLTPEGRGPAPVRPAVPSGPVVQESRGKKAPVRTFQDLLKDSFDESLFDHYMTSQLVLINTLTGRTTPLGSPAIIDASPSPSGEYFLVERTVRPYSYTVPAGLFPEVVEVWDRSGKPVFTLANVPLRDEVPIEGVPTGPRGANWRPTAPATLMWAEALDGGDPKAKAAQRDKIMALDAPFAGQAREVFRTTHRYSGAMWADKGDGPAKSGGLMMYAEFDRDRRWSTTWMFDMDTPGSEAVKVFDRSIRDAYADPGDPVMTQNAAGRAVVQQHAGAIFLTGQGATPDGNRPFLDRMDLATLKIERLWRCEAGVAESVVDLLSPDGSSFLTRRESPDQPPNFFKRSGGSEPVRLTDFPHPAPQLRDVKKQLVKYTRADGTELSATIYLPPGFDPEQVKRGEAKPLPLVIWAYPLEYNDRSTAGQVTASPNSFTMFRGSDQRLLTLAGYAVMDNATMPIVGDPETMNDTFVEQIVSSAKAAIDFAVDMGVADRDRVAVMGHSYGGFMTANLLAHCDLFRAGVARSGAYNRTLTPFGFQGERRTYWQARDTYEKISPFTWADQIKTPLLLIHGQNDANPGTFPVQSERLFAAIQGNGGTARLLMLPFEDHGYQGRESVHTVHAETLKWLDEWVKNAPPREATGK